MSLDVTSHPARTCGHVTTDAVSPVPLYPPHASVLQAYGLLYVYLCLRDCALSYITTQTSVFTLIVSIDISGYTYMRITPYILSSLKVILHRMRCITLRCLARTRYLTPPRPVWMHLYSFYASIVLLIAWKSVVSDEDASAFSDCLNMSIKMVWRVADMHATNRACRTRRIWRTTRQAGALLDTRNILVTCVRDDVMKMAIISLHCVEILLDSVQQPLSLRSKKLYRRRR